MKKITVIGWCRSVLCAIVAFMLIGCNDSPMQPTSGSLSLSMRMSANGAGTALPKISNSAFGAAVGSIQLTRVRVVLSKIELDAVNDSIEFRVAPMVLELDLSGAMQTIGVMGIPFGTYNEVEFKIHRVDSTDLTTIPPADQANFVDFLQNPRASVIVEGLAYTNGTGQSFIFRSGLEAEQEYDLTPPITVSDANLTVNLTINIDSAMWFRNRAGALLDPADPNNKNQISNNIKASLKVYEDDDRDGEDDDDDGDNDDNDDGDGGGD